LPGSANQPEEISKSLVFQENKMPAGIKTVERKVNFVVQKLSKQTLKLKVCDAQDGLMISDLQHYKTGPNLF
jgi:hypothetical protein